MTFRKDSLLFYESEILSVVMLMLCLTLIPILGMGLTIVCMFPFVVLILINPKLRNEYITINEIGISCQKSGKQLWAYEWDNIAQLKKSRRFRQPSIEIVTYNKYGEEEPFVGPYHYFQLGKEAKEAIERYYKPIEYSTNR